METNTISKEEPVKKSKMKDLWEILKFAIVALLIVIPIRTYIAKPFIVEGASMVPTFKDKNYLIVDEISYHLGDPKRGDVVVFHPPQNPSVYYIKRVIGLPGETVVIKNGIVTIKNKENPEGMILEEPYVSEIGTTTLTKEIGPLEYFVMGDNRPYSSDSRYWGALPRDHIEGRAFLRLLPVDDIDLFPGEHRTY
jgi:signal peptidase I